MHYSHAFSYLGFNYTVWAVVSKVRPIVLLGNLGLLSLRGLYLHLHLRDKNISRLSVDQLLNHTLGLYLHIVIRVVESFFKFLICSKITSPLYGLLHLFTLRWELQSLDMF